MTSPTLAAATIFVVGILVGSCVAFTPASFQPRTQLDRKHSTTTTTTTSSGDGTHLLRVSHRYSSSSSDTNDYNFMASLQRRMDQVAENDNKLPLVVMDCMLPRQVLNITINNRLLMELVRTRLQDETPCFGMVGKARVVTGTGDGNNNSSNGPPLTKSVTLSSGVEVEIIGKPQITSDGRLKLSLKGGRRFRIQPDTVESTDRGWTQARVKFLNSTVDDKAEVSSSSSSDPMSIARAMQMAREFTDPNFSMTESQSLVNMWLELARQRERQPGQIDRLLQDLGPMPSWKVPTECAMWVGALINPIPALGVSLEIRPQLLLAKTAEERTQIVLDALWNSIQHMQGANRFKQIKE